MAKKKLNHGIIMRILDWAYAKSLSGMGGIDSAIELGESYLKEKGTLSQQVDSLVKWQTTKAGVSGFVTGFGGMAALPITLPANIASVIYIQIRMISAIAYMGGHDLKEDKIKTFVYLCMVGNGAKEMLKNLGIKTGEKLVTHLFADLSAKAVVHVNQNVGYKLLAKFSEKSIANMGKIVPVVGGLIGGGLDVVSTRAIGAIAKKMFIDIDEHPISES